MSEGRFQKADKSQSQQCGWDFLVPQISHNWNMARGYLLTHFLGETVEGGVAVVSVAEETYADAFPIAGAHGEGFACWDEADAIDAERELVTISLTVVGDAYPEAFELALLDDFALALRLQEDAVFAEADTTERLARAEETGKAVARSGE